MRSLSPARVVARAAASAGKFSSRASPRLSDAYIAAIDGLKAHAAPDDQWAVNCRVLVGDDNADAADMMALLLERVGCEVVRVYDGRSAIASAERMRPDLILLDIGLPDMAGHDICRAVRRQPWGSRATIAAVTGWGQSSDVAASLDAGFDVHLETGLGRTDRRAVAGFQTRRFRRAALTGRLPARYNEGSSLLQMGQWRSWERA